MNLTDELEIISDEQQRWTANTLFNAPDSLFKSNPTNTKPEFHTYWARFKLANTTPHREGLSFESEFWDYVKLYFQDSTGSVTMVPFGILSDPYDNHFIAQPHSEYNVLAKFESSDRFRRENNINLVIKSTLPDLKSKTVTYFLDGIIFGIMFGLALYNLFLFVSLKDRTYMWYSLYILSFALSFITLFSNAPSKWTLFLSPDYPLLGFYIKKFADPIAWIAYVNFVRQFLSTKVKYPRWDNFLKIFIGLILLQLFLNLTGIYHFTGIYRVITWNTTIAFCVILAIFSYVQGYTKAKFFLLGQFFIMTGVVITFAYYAGLDLLAFLPKTDFFDYLRSATSLFVFGAIESIVFSLALASKYNGLQKDIVQIRLEKEKEKQDLLASQNEMLEQQVNEQTKELRQSLENLKTTQTQLVQAEKMASLGVLTAGIAHEIQNPLNFINNFSEINIEIVEELSEERMSDSADSKSESVSQLLKNLKKNSVKINSHGQRLDAIVKSMLQHSRRGATHFEVVDINALCNDCLKLSYHGFRATESAFTAQFEAELDPDLPTTTAIQQDLRRGLLNIINNAFYAVNAKRKDQVVIDEESSYHPVVKVTTAVSLQDISITIADNGNGIPDEVLDKIFQPFFTTKPTGKGTGLGLSLTYDIIVKGHGGELKVRSKKGLGTEFEILLPIKKRT